MFTRDEDDGFALDGLIAQFELELLGRLASIAIE